MRSSAAALRTKARRTLATAVRNYPWTTRQADHPTVWVSHVLRREAEAMILPDLAVVPPRPAAPSDNDQRLALLGVCQARGRYAAAAQLYADAFAADPELADQLTEECLQRAAGEARGQPRRSPQQRTGAYLAARCAALRRLRTRLRRRRPDRRRAGHWRDQARDWLQADLCSWGRILRGEQEPRRHLARQMLMLWQADPDLAPIREPRDRSTLSDPEHEQWTAFWEKAEAILERGRSSE